MPARLVMTSSICICGSNLLLKADTNAWALLIGNKILRAACRVHDLSNSLLQRIRVTKTFLLLHHLDWNSSCNLERGINSATERRIIQAMRVEIWHRVVASYLVWRILKEQFCAVQCVTDGIFVALHAVDDYEQLINGLLPRRSVAADQPGSERCTVGSIELFQDKRRFVLSP